MINILTIDTATKNCSVALFSNQKCIAAKELDGQFSHAENLHDFIVEVMKAAGLNWNDINAVAVSEGPGSYTGLRIGLSTCKGLCYALNIPLIAINTLQNMAYGIRENLREDPKWKNKFDNLLYCPMIDARRMEVYTAIFDGKLNSILPTQALIIEDNNSLIPYFEKNTTVVFGNGAEKCAEFFKPYEKAIFLPSNEPTASAINMGSLAHERYLHNQFEDIAYYEPKYLKQFQGTVAKKLI